MSWISRIVFWIALSFLAEFTLRQHRELLWPELVAGNLGAVEMLGLLVHTVMTIYVVVRTVGLVFEEGARQ